jgi:protein O-GlcNAc transferase
MLRRLLARLKPAGRAAARAGPHAPAAAQEAMALIGQARWREAIRLLESVPQDHPAVAANLGLCHAALGEWAAAEHALLRSVAMEPAFAPAHLNLGNVLLAQQRMEQALLHYEEAARLAPGNPGLHNNRGMVLRYLGRPSEACDAFREALAATDEATNPTLADAHSNLLYTLHLSPGVSMSAIHDEARRYANRHEPAPLPARPAVRDADPARRLRVGYVSPDLRRHSVAHFFEPLLRAHDAARFEAHCFQTSSVSDDVTRHLRALADGAGHAWHEAAGLAPATLAQRIRDAGIDLLVDLSGHTQGHSLRCFMLRPAPLQLTWLGFPGTTGLACMDARITDAVADPAGAEAWHTERLLRTGGAQWCYWPGPAGPSAGRSAVPSPDGPGFRFGCFSNFAKVNDVLLSDWARILAAAPHASLTLTGVPGERTRERVQRRFGDAGVDPARVRLLPSLDDASLGRERAGVHVVLDTHPYNGVTTSCEALSAGIPVVSLAGDGGSRRSGASLLARLDLPRLAAASRESYVCAAVELANAPRPLAGLRAELPARFESSSLRDAAGFAREMELLYRSLWSDAVSAPER